MMDLIRPDSNWESQCTLLRQMGRGRFGSVSLVRRGDHCLVCHIIHRTTDIEDKWRRLRALQLKPHPCLEQLIHVFVLPNRLAIYTHHYGDFTLLDFIRSFFEPMLPETQILRWLCHILDGLQFLHMNGLRHGNLCAKTILLVPGHPKLLRLTSWSLSIFSRKPESRTDLECLGSVLLVLITLNSALDGRTLPSDTVASLLKNGQAYFSDFLLSITQDLISNSMESVSYLRGLMAAPDDPLYGSQPDMPSLEGDQQISQVDASPIHRRERARILHQLAEEAARASRGHSPKHPSMIITFFNLFKMSIKSWKRVLKRRYPPSSDGGEGEIMENGWHISDSTVPHIEQGLHRSVSCPGLYCYTVEMKGPNASSMVTG